MQNDTQKFHWGAMSWTILALGGIVTIIYLFGGFDANTAAIAVQ